MALLITTTTLAALNVATKSNFEEGLAKAKAMAVAPRIATMETTTTRKTKFPLAVDSAQIREHIGPRHVNVVKASDQDLEVLPYELTYGVDRDDLEDEDQGPTSVKLLAKTIRAAGRKYALMPDRLLYTVISGNATSVYDGRSLFGTHYQDPTDTSSTSWSNAKTSRALTPENLASTIADQAKLLSPDGDPINPAQRFVLMVPWALHQTALECTRAQMIPNSAGTASRTNVIPQAYNIEVVPWARLDAASATTWYLLDVSDPSDQGLIVLERKAPEIIEQFSPSDDRAIEFNQFTWTSRARMQAGGGNPARIFRCVA